MNFSDIIRAIQSNNQDVSGGQIKSDEEELLIRLRSRSTDPNKIGNIILMGPNDLSSIVDTLDRPALFVYSSLGWAVEAADEVRQHWPESTVEVIDESSHALFVDQPERFNRVLEEFIATLPGP